MSSRPNPTPRRLLTSCAALLVTGLVGTGWAKPASAAMSIDPFAGLQVTQTGCSTTEITAAPGGEGARLSRGGDRVRVGSVLTYDQFGLVVLRATVKPGYVLTRTSYEVTAPVSCFTLITVYDPDDEVLAGVNSWCDDDQAVMSAAASGVGPRSSPAHWALTRLKTGRVVASGTFYLGGFDQVSTQLPAGLPYGKFRLGFTLDEVPGTFPASYRVEHYRCVKPVAKVGQVVFRAPAGGPDVFLVLYNVHAPDDDLPTYLTVKAGHTYRLHTTLRTVAWSATATPKGTHVGSMGSGEVTVPQPTT